MTFVVLVVGGITRLTLSGLSIVDWKPLMGVIPPLTDAQWQATFDSYRQFPEYQTWRQRHDAGRVQVHLLLGIPAPSGRADDRARVPGPLRHLLAARLADGPVDAARAAVVRARRNAGRHGLAHGEERAGGPSEREPLPAGGAPEPRVPDLRHGRVAGARSRHARRRHICGHRTATDAARPDTGRRRARRADRVGRVRRRAPGGAVLPDVSAHGRQARTRRPARARRRLASFVANPIAVQWTHRVLGTLLALLAVGLFVQVRRASRIGPRTGTAERFWR
jgi:hypothetical protein